MLATPVALVTAVVGLTLSTAAQLAVLDVMLIAALVAESKRERWHGAEAEMVVNRA
jgi:hypothetical protein